MKKILFFATTLALATMGMAQTFVDTTAQKRNVVIEEFTGVNCTYCPDGHKIVNQIIADFPGRISAINIHQGSYAAAYTTRWGDAIANQTGLTGYPAGTVNRHVFSGSKTALQRNQFRSSANTIMGLDSPVNVAAKAYVDFFTRTIEIDVEVYYTSNSATSPNMLNVAILQDNILGPQVGATNFYPEMMVGNLYRHNHMLRDLVTGQWGDTIHQTTAGTFVSRHYSYEIPDKISNVAMKAPDLKVVAFIAQGKQEILTGCNAEMTYYGCYADELKVEKSDCDISFAPYFVVSNMSNERVTDITIPYTYTGVADTLLVTDTLEPNTTDTIYLPNYAVETAPTGSANYYAEAAITKMTRLFNAPQYDTTYTLDTTITDTLRIDTLYTIYEGDTSYTSATIPATADSSEIASITVIDSSYGIYSMTIDTNEFSYIENEGGRTKVDLINVYTAPGPFYLHLVLDQYGAETTVKFRKQSDCSVIFEDGPFDNDENRNSKAIYFNFDPAEAGLYILSVYDSYGDGNKGFRLRDGEGNYIFTNSGNFGSEATYYLNVTTNGTGRMDGIEAAANATTLSVYPNPVCDELRIDCGETVNRLEIMDLAGRTVIDTKQATNTIGTKNLTAGMYILRVTTESGISVQKFVKK
ncbi:MAG: Omp28-related outer membrane protein [Bacteroidales bacterium]|nr:Omp28-related outer membrane protein [Bacteroidales bacterium]